MNRCEMTQNGVIEFWHPKMVANSDAKRSNAQNQKYILLKYTYSYIRMKVDHMAYRKNCTHSISNIVVGAATKNATANRLVSVWWKRGFRSHISRTYIESHSNARCYVYNKYLNIYLCEYWWCSCWYLEISKVSIHKLRIFYWNKNCYQDLVVLLWNVNK